MPIECNRPPEAYIGERPYIFISYAHMDQNWVFDIIHWLNRNGYRVWYDEGIDPGNEWPDEIAQALENSSLFIVFITKSAVLSKNVINEIYFALDERKPFIAIYLEDTKLPSGLKLRIGSTQAIMKFRMTNDMFESKLKKIISSELRDEYLYESVSNSVSLISQKPIILSKDGIETEEMNATMEWKEQTSYWGFNITTAFSQDAEAEEDLKTAFLQTCLNSVPVKIGQEIKITEQDGFSDIFILTDILGCGGVSKVFLVEEIHERKFAMKIAHHNKISKESLEREMEFLTSFDSKNVVKCSGLYKKCSVFNSGDYIANKMPVALVDVLLLEYIKGKPLEYVINNNIDFFSATKYSIKIAETLKYIHDNGIIHNNLTTSNIMVCENGDIKIIDFTSAKWKRNLDPDTLSGTLLYMSPEVLELSMKYSGENTDIITTKSDIYSYGVVLYRIFSKTFPFCGNVRYTKDVFNKQPKVIEGLDSQTWLVIERCLAKNPSDRFSDFGEILQMLK